MVKYEPQVHSELAWTILMGIFIPLRAVDFPIHGTRTYIGRQTNTVILLVQRYIPQLTELQNIDDCN